MEGKPPLHSPGRRYKRGRSCGRELKLSAETRPTVVGFVVVGRVCFFLSLCLPFYNTRTAYACMLAAPVSQPCIASVYGYSWMLPSESRPVRACFILRCCASSIPQQPIRSMSRKPAKKEVLLNQQYKAKRLCDCRLCQCLRTSHSTEWRGQNCNSFAAREILKFACPHANSEIKPCHLELSHKAISITSDFVLYCTAFLRPCV